MAEGIVAEEIIRDLEVAELIIWASPDLVSAQQRQTAENVFLQFHKTAPPYQLCQQILELSTTDYILFETVKLLKTAVIREWSKISESDLTSVRQYLMHYVINKPSLAPFVMAKILEVIAVIIKRSSIVDAEQERIQGLHEIVSLVKNGDLPKQILGCSMLTAIIREYVMYNKTSTICLPLGVHYQEKVKLQENYLKIIFELCIQMLTTLIEKDFDEPVLLLVKHVLIVTDDVLDWEYIDKDYHIIAVSKMRKEAIRLLKPEGVAYIVDLAPNIPYVYPRIVKRGLMRTVVRINAAIQDTSIQEHYWSKTLELLQNRWKYLILNSNFESSHHEGDIKIQIIHLLESFIGAIQGGGRASIAHSVHRYTYPVLAELPKLLFLYRNCPGVVQLILEFFCKYAKKILCYLSMTDATPVYDIYSKAMQTYVDYNRDRVTVNETAKEDICNDILLFIKLYNHLLDKNDFACEEVEEDEPYNWSEGNKKYPPIETFLSLLGIVIPMIDRNLLQFPSLCLQYYEMLFIPCYSVAHNFYELSSSNKKVVEQLLATVVLGLHTFSLEVSNNCSKIIRVFCQEIFEARIHTGLPKNEIMVPFVNLILDSVLSHQFHLSLVPVIGEILYYLVYCYQEEYFQYVQITLSNYTNEQIVEMLNNAFNELITDIDWNLNISSYKRAGNLKTFKTNFVNFLLNVQGLLMTK